MNVFKTPLEQSNIYLFWLPPPCVLAFNMDQEIPDYDMDSEDDTWLTEQSKKMEITPLKFEEMMDRLEKGSGQQVCFFSNHSFVCAILRFKPFYLIT